MLPELACLSVQKKELGEHKWYHVELKSPTLDKDLGTSSSILKQLIIYLKTQGVSEVDVILAAEAVDLSATSATGEVELILHR